MTGYVFRKKRDFGYGFRRESRSFDPLRLYRRSFGPTGEIGSHQAISDGAP